MKSPVTGKKMVLSNKDCTVLFRKEEFTINYKFYWCKDTQQEFTTTALDTFHLNQVYKQYIDRNHLSF